MWGVRAVDRNNCSPLEIVKLQKNLLRIVEGEGIGFVYGSGKKKQEIQRLYEELEDCEMRLMDYKDCFELWEMTATVIPKQIWKRLLCV